MKKMIPFIIMTIILAGCSIVKEFPANNVTVNEIQDKLYNKETFMLVVANKERCSPCESYLKGGLRGLSDKNDYKIDYITIDTLDKQADISKLSKIIYDDFKETETKIGVPTTYIVSNGKIVERLKGPIVYEEIVQDYERYIQK